MLDDMSLFYQKFEPLSIKEDFRRIGGYEEVKKTLKLYCNLLDKNYQLKEWHVQVQGKVLLYGPPGTGKTLIVRALAHEMEIPLISIRTVQIRSKYIAEAGQNLEALALDLKNNHQRSIVFFDEFDTLAMDRGKRDLNSEDQKVVNAILTAFDSISLVEDQILIIAATNQEQILDDAVWRRFDEIIFMGLPNVEQRRSILQILTRKIPKTFMKIESFGKLAEITEDWSGADLQRLINHAVITYLGQKGSKTELDLNFFKDIIDSGIISPTTLKHHRTFQQMRQERLSKEMALLKQDENNEDLVKDLGKKRLWE